MELQEGARVGVVGGGPAGTLTSYFILEMAQRAGLSFEVDIYEGRDFSRAGPAGCNMCGGIVSESLVQMLAAEGINLPPPVVQRGIDSYVLHTDVGQVRIATPGEEMRIAALHRGSGPRGAAAGPWKSFDGFLLDLACEKGARHIPGRVKELTWQDGLPAVQTDGQPARPYDLLVGATGINASGHKLFEKLGFRYEQPRTAKTSMLELLIGREKLQDSLGNAMHVFLLDLPRLEFAALIPKGEYISVCLLGHDIDRELVDHFMHSGPVRSCLTEDYESGSEACHCSPRINIGEAKHLFTDRVVLVGDCGVSRLYKDGIGAAYRAAKACAATVVLHGVSEEDFQKFYWPACKRMQRDNRVGKALFLSAGLFRRLAFLTRAMLNVARSEQRPDSRSRALSTVVWDTFTGSAPYTDVLLRSLKPGLVLPFAAACCCALLPFGEGKGSG